MRGKPLFSALGGNNSRITPADAGKTCLSLKLSKSEWDHPRGCGENTPLCVVYRNERGSPPRMRGKQRTVHSSRNRCRITPADAGKTLYWLSRWAVCRDHPRGCGENPTPNCGGLNAKGSPPRMRGKPANGGGYETDAVDHPRGCGENCSEQHAVLRPEGSPPRMRGKR